jgi:hypothetical protein
MASRTYVVTCATGTRSRRRAAVTSDVNTFGRAAVGTCGLHTHRRPRRRDARVLPLMRTRTKPTGTESRVVVCDNSPLFRARIRTPTRYSREAYGRENWFLFLCFFVRAHVVFALFFAHVLSRDEWEGWTTGWESKLWPVNSFRRSIPYSRLHCHVYAKPSVAATKRKQQQ